MHLAKTRSISYALFRSTPLRDQLRCLSFSDFTIKNAKSACRKPSLSRCGSLPKLGLRYHEAGLLEARNEAGSICGRDVSLRELGIEVGHEIRAHLEKDCALPGRLDLHSGVGINDGCNDVVQWKVRQIGLLDLPHCSCGIALHVGGSANVPR